MPQMNEPDLANYKHISEYVPGFSDFVVRTTIFRSYVGVVNRLDPASDSISIIFEGTPRLLFTLTEEEMRKQETRVKLDDIRNQRKGSWAICKVQDGKSVWYI